MKIAVLITAWNKGSLIKKIFIGTAIGVILALTLGQMVSVVAVLGSLFVGALRSVAPVLVFTLVMASIVQQKSDSKINLKAFLALSFSGMFIAAIIGVGASFLFPTHLVLSGIEQADIEPPKGITAVLHNLFINLVDNPIRAISNANYIGILAWSLLLGIALKKTASSNVKEVIVSVSDAVVSIVRLVIGFAPFGIMGLVYSSIMESGIETFVEYGRLLAVLVTTMLIVTLVTNPLLAFLVMKRNPYPLVFRALKDSGLTAFFTRSSAANIPVNLALCEKLGINKDMYSVAIPLGATINMSGAAITISVLAMATANTLGIPVDFFTAVILCIVTMLGALGASGVAGGSLLLIPLACSLLGIPDSISMQVVGIGFVISVVQDSCETALNSHSDVVFLGSIESRRLNSWGEKMAFGNNP